MKSSSFTPKTPNTELDLDKHSRFVRLLKVFLPSLAALLIGSLLAWPKLNDGQPLLKGMAPKIGRDDVQTMTVVNPTFLSVDRRMQPFVLNAEKAEEQVDDRNIVRLSAPKGEIDLQSGRFLTFLATSGTYAKEEQILSFAGDVAIFSDDGYALVTESSEFHIAARRVIGRYPVTVTGNVGEIKGQGFSISNGGKTVSIKGKAEIVWKEGAL